MRDNNLIHQPRLELRVLRTREHGRLLQREPLARRPRKVDVFEVEVAELDDLVLDGGWDVALEEDRVWFCLGLGLDGSGGTRVGGEGHGSIEAVCERMELEQDDDEMR